MGLGTDELELQNDEWVYRLRWHEDIIYDPITYPEKELIQRELFWTTNYLNQLCTVFNLQKIAIILLTDNDLPK